MIISEPDKISSSCTIINLAFVNFAQQALKMKASFDRQIYIYSFGYNFNTEPNGSNTQRVVL